jgi:hypothetical protein
MSASAAFPSSSPLRASSGVAAPAARRAAAAGSLETWSASGRFATGGPSVLVGLTLSLGVSLVLWAGILWTARTLAH